ncbi:hypothetical protein ONZ45_g15790 [Pleurotus djamor]|nr:hypothetical protein ONZ45_g15790 [Pleurotus djamor]
MELPAIVDTSLHDYLERYNHIDELPDYEDKVRDLVNYALCGIDLRRESSFIRINMVNHYRLEGNNNLPQLGRDYDSLLGFTEDIPVRRSLRVLPLPPPHLSSIRAKMHVKVPFNTRTTVQSLDPSEVPNILFAKYDDDRHQIRIFFPRLIDADREDFLVNQLSSEEAALLWREAIKPAFAYAAPRLVKDWPTTLNSERWRAKNIGQGYQRSAYILSSTVLPYFKEKLMELLDQIPQFRHAVFCTHIQGVKADFPHTMFPEDAEWTLAKMLKDVDTSEGHWWIDVGVELQDGGQALLWRETAHANVMSYLLQIPIGDAGVIKNSRAFQNDMNSHLKEIAGFHVAFAQPTGPFQATYMQLYTTDKSLTFHRNGNQFSQNLTLREAMRGLPPEYLDNYLDVLNEAMEKNVAARVEARVPLTFAETFMMDFDMDVIRGSIVSLKRENFWNFRAMKIHAMQMLFSSLNSLTREQTLLPPVLSLYAVAIWYTNGVHSRPKDGQGGRECASVGVPWYNDYDRDFLLSAGYTVAALNGFARQYDQKPFSPLNVIWLRRIYFQPESNVVRMPMIRHLQPAMYKRVFGKTELELKNQYGSKAIIRRRDLPKERYPANKGMSRQFNGPVPDNQPTFPTLEDIVDEPIEVMGPDVATADNTICVLQKIGNPKNIFEPSYCRLSQEARQRATMKIMQTSNLAVVFTKVQVLQANQKAWLASCNAFFPSKGRCANPSSQGWGGMLYYGDWVDLMNSLDEQDAAEVRSVVFEILTHISWLPKATFDRPVRTNREGAPWRTLPSSAGKVPAPLVLLSPYFEGQWRWVPGAPLTDDEGDGGDGPNVLEESEGEGQAANDAVRREEEEESTSSSNEDQYDDQRGNDVHNDDDEHEDDDLGDEGHEGNGGPVYRVPSRAPSIAASQQSHGRGSQRSQGATSNPLAPSREASQRRTPRASSSQQQDIRRFLAPTANRTAQETPSVPQNAGNLHDGSIEEKDQAALIEEKDRVVSTEEKDRVNKRKIEQLKRSNAKSALKDKVGRMREEEEEEDSDDSVVPGGVYFELSDD